MASEPKDDYPTEGPPESNGRQGSAPIYERRLSIAQRTVRLLTSPKDAMEDIALAPEYGGVVMVIVAISILSAIGVIISAGKVQFTGSYADDIMAYNNILIGVEIFTVPVLFLVRWLVKSFLVRYACDNGSQWSFKTAASVTGYAYLVTVVVLLIELWVIWYFVPSVVIDTTDLETVETQIASYRAQTAWLQIIYALPAAVVQLVWKSYLGGLGAHMGTRKMCSLGQGLAAFLILGFISFMLSFYG